MSASLPKEVRALFWEVDPDAVDLLRHRDYVVERVMARGGWEAMRWLKRAYPRAELADFLARKGSRLAPRERAYWSLVLGVEAPRATGGGRPPWAGP